MNYDICNFCGLPLRQNDGTAIHLEVKGKLYEYSFHNRNNSDCLALKIQELRKQFPLPQLASAQPDGTA